MEAADRIFDQDLSGILELGSDEDAVSLDVDSHEDGGSTKHETVSIHKSIDVVDTVDVDESSAADVGGRSETCSPNSALGRPNNQQSDQDDDHEDPRKEIMKRFEEAIPNLKSVGILNGFCKFFKLVQVLVLL